MNAEGYVYRHSRLTRQMIRVFFEVHGELGYGFLESVYRSAMTVALRDAGLAAEPEVVEIGLILNFGPAPNIRRLAFANERKNPSFVPLT